MENKRHKSVLSKSNYAWEQRKLGDVAEFSKGRGYSKEDLEETGDPIILYGRLYTDYQAVISSVNTYVMKKGNSILSRGGEVIVPASGETPEDIARASVVETPGILLGGDLNIIRLRSQFIPEFVVREISNGACQKELSKKAQGKSVVHINPADLQEVVLIYPESSEQKQISSFFATVDHLITLHQRKVELLKRKKQAYLQQIFSQGLRFRGYVEKWGRRQIGDYLIESRIPGSNGVTANKLTVKLWNKGVVAKKDLYLGSSATNYYVRHAGQFMYGKLDFLHQAFGIVPPQLDGFESTQDSPAFDISDNLNSTYFVEYVSRKSFYLYQGTLANGSRQAKRIHANVFLSMPLIAPSKAEQDDISRLLISFDQIVANCQRQIELLEEKKEFFLRRLFIR